MRLEHRDLTERETEKFWRQDRKNLVLCRSSNQSMQMFYQDLKDRLSAPGS